MKSLRFYKNIFNKKGITLVEAIISVAIFALVVVAAGRFIVFSLSSWNQTQSDAYAISKTSNVIYVMEKEVRQAVKPSPQLNPIRIYPQAFDSDETSTEGIRLEIVTDLYDSQLTITYLVYEDALWKIYDVPPEHPDDLAGLTPLISRVSNTLDEEDEVLQYFESNADGNILITRFNVIDNKDASQVRFEVNTRFTVRGQGEFK